MEYLEKLKQWLTGFPGWAEALQVDTTAQVPESCGLFPLGLEQLSRREDVLGNVSARYRMKFLLRRVAVRQQTAAQWLLSFQEWVRQQSEAGLAPRLGDVPSAERLRAEKGRLSKVSQTGTATYEVQLTAEFIKEENNGED